MEVACKDLGAVYEGFFENFALDVLELGGSEVGNISKFLSAFLTLNIRRFVNYKKIFS